MFVEISTLLAILLGLGAGIGWGFSGFFDAKASKTVGPLTAAFLINCLIAVLYTVVFLLVWRGHFISTPDGLWLAAGSGVAITIGALSYFKGLSIGPVSLVSPMSSSYPLVTTLLAVFVFNARLSLQQACGIVLIVSGIMIVTGLIKPQQLRALESRGPLLGFGAAVGWGIGYTLLAQAVHQIGWQSATLIEFCAMALAFGFCIPLVNSGRFVALTSVKAGLGNKNVLLASSIALGAALSFNIGLSHDSASGVIVATLSACYPILTVLLALRKLGESIALMPLLGAACSIAGVLVIAAIG